MKLREIIIQNPDGSYEVSKKITIKSDKGEISLNPGVKMRPGVKFMGVDITELLDQEVKEEEN